MSLTVDQLNRNILDNSHVKDTIREQLDVIDKQITRQGQQFGENTLIYSLPVVFGNVTSDPSIISRIVYASIIKSLVKRGFNIKYIPSDTKPRLCIRWNIVVNESEIKAYDDYLKKYI